uniref:BCL2 associated X, apoptosis regulator n=1 Tax=Loxodonta africana TaxID=9785 RepID=G3SQJ6_LOXAF
MDGSGEQPRGGGPTNSEHIMKTGALLLQGFIQDRAKQMGGETPELALERVPQDPSTKKLSECLKRIGDELDSNLELQRMIAAVDTDSPREVFFRVAAEMFSDGNFNWGRVVALFYFASKLVLKVGGCRTVERRETVVGRCLLLIHLFIQQTFQGAPGRDGLLSYFGTPTWQTVTIFVAGVLTASLTIWKKMG